MLFILLGIVSTIAAGVTMKILEYNIKRIGKIKVHIKKIIGSSNILILRIDIVNRKNSIALFRDLNLVFLENNQIVEHFLQARGEYIDSSGKTTGEIYGGDSSYSIMVKEKSVIQIIGGFISIKGNIDYTKELAIRFFDEKDKEQIYKIEYKDFYKKSEWTTLAKCQNKKSQTK